MAHIAERAAARADVAHDHERGRAVAEAFADVRTRGFFADAVQFLLAHQRLHPLHFFAAGELGAYPARLAQAFFADVVGVFCNLADLFRAFFLDAHGFGLEDDWFCLLVVAHDGYPWKLVYVAYFNAACVSPWGMA